MAAGAGGAHGGSFESTVDRKFSSVTNTMESIQGLSTWCIDNKKYHSLIVRHWVKCLKKSNASQKLNLIYLANDVIQNCKRKNAIVYRTAFADILPEAFSQVIHEGDAKVVRSVERILSIWEERSVYSGPLITELRGILLKEDSPPETPVEQKTPIQSKADICSKIVAEFVPQALVDQLSKYKRSLEEVDLREKQLAAMRIDICSSETLKKLKDKAGGRKFSKDFEEASAKLQEFVKFFDRQNKIGPHLLEALNNADIFYEMQYKEVKIVANAYQTFANRVSLLKRKLDNLKATLPNLDDSPIPSPSADAPSPTGSESPFHGLDVANPDPDLDGLAMDEDAEPPAPSPLSSPGGSPNHLASLGENDNREVEDMDLSEEEPLSGDIIVEEQLKAPPSPVRSIPVPANTEPSAPDVPSIPHVAPPVAAPAASVGGVDLGKIESILNSLSSALKPTGPTMESPASARTGSSAESKPAASVASESASSLVNLLSKVEMSPADLLSALSKVQGQGSLEGTTSKSSPVANVPSVYTSAGKNAPSHSSTSASAAPPQSATLSSITPVLSSSTVKQSTNSKVPPRTNAASAPVQTIHRDMEFSRVKTKETAKSESLESKIHNFLHGNPAFSNFDFGFSMNTTQGGDNMSPLTGADNQGGTPVRDEGGGTPTQDEMMDKPAGRPSSVGGTGKSAGFQYSTQKDLEPPKPQAHMQPGMSQNGQSVPPNTSAGIVPESPRGLREQGWYGDAYPEGNFQQPAGYNVPMAGGAGENLSSGHYSYHAEQTQELQASTSQQGVNPPSDFFRNMLPPVPKLPPPPIGFENPASVPGTAVILPEQQPAPGAAELAQAPGNSVMSGMVVHDHGHKSMFHPDDPQHDLERHHYGFQEDRERYSDGHRPPDRPFLPRHHLNDPYSPPHRYPRGRGGLAPAVSPSEGAYFQRHGPPPPFPPRRPPPHLEVRPPGLRPPLRPPHPGHQLHPPRGPLRAPFPRFHGPDLRLRGKRLGPRGGGDVGPMFPPKRPFLPPRY